jgi:hypothetical protein
MLSISSTEAHFVNRILSAVRFLGAEDAEIYLPRIEKILRADALRRSGWSFTTAGKVT